MPFDLLDAIAQQKARFDVPAAVQALRQHGETTVEAREILDLEPAPEPGVAQRWKRRRDYYRSTDTSFDPKRWRVDLIGGKSGLPGGMGRRDWWSRGRRFIVENHYAASFPQVRAMVGLFAASDGALAGVATFSNAKADQAARYGDVSTDAIMELSRLVLLDEVPGNAESWFLTRAIECARVLHAERGHNLSVVLSYSDPVPRRSVLGYLTMPGHVGNVYQARNALYVGHARSKALHLDRRGVAPDPRMLSKIVALDRRDERGGVAAVERFVSEYGAPRRGRGESHAAWVRRALASPAFRRIEHGGNLTYLWTLGDRRLRRELERNFPPRLPYPKTPRQLYLNLHRKYQRAWSRGATVQVSQLADEVLEAWVALRQDEKQGLPDPPQIGVACSVPPRGSPNRVQGWTLAEIMDRVVCGGA